MARQNVGTPRFYIDSGLYQQSIGAWTPNDDQKSLVQLNPTNVVGKPNNDIIIPRISPIRYVAFLGHSGGSYYPLFDDTDVDGFTEVVNMNGSQETDEDYSGFSIGIFSDREDATGVKGVIGNEDSTIGAVSIGNYYDMPHSPDLNLKLTTEYDGVKTIQTKGGATLSNASYTKPADWGDSGAWQLGSVDGQGASNLRSGRRVWDLSFSYLNDSDIMPNLGVQNYEDEAITEDILSGTDFFSQVINRTMGGHLPFIFQPDGANADPKADGFAICRFDMKSFTYDQVANNVYNVKLKIREVW